MGHPKSGYMEGSVCGCKRPDPATAMAPHAAGNTGQLLWKDNWVTFLDTMLQMSILGSAQRSLRLPTRIAAIHIDPATHQQKVYTLQGEAQGSQPRPPHPCVPAPLRQALPTLTTLLLPCSG